MDLRTGNCTAVEPVRPDVRPESILYGRSVVQMERDGVFLSVDPEGPNWISTNAAGALILRRCDGHHTLDEVVAGLNSSHGLGRAEATAFIHRLCRTGLVAVSPDLAPSYPGRGQVILPSALEELWIQTNNSCPLRCRHCLVDGGEENGTPLTTSEIRDVVDQALLLGVKRFYFTGGDPMLRPDILVLINYVTERAQLVMLTSGVLITPDLAAALAAIPQGKLMLQISLEGPEPAPHDAMRGAGSFGRALRGINLLMANGLNPVVTTTLTRLNFKRAADTTRFLAGIGILDQHILWLHERGRLRQNSADLLLDGETVARTMAELNLAAADTGIILDNTVSLGVRVKYGRGVKNDLCHAGYGLLSMGTDGRVFPCAALTGLDRFNCGSLKEKGLREIWTESMVLAEVRENSVQKKDGCSSCFLKYFCGGGCFTQAYLSHETATGSGCLMAEDPYCAVYHSQILDLMWSAASPETPDMNEKRPVLYGEMTEEPAACSHASNRITDAAHNVNTYHCSCVLATETGNRKESKTG